MLDDLVLLDVDEGVATISFNRPERHNAWNGPLYRAYYRCLAACDLDEAVRVIVLTGSGTSFCPGADTTSLEVLRDDGRADPDNQQIGVNREHDEWLPATVRKPMVAAINGACAGMGLVQALYCDVRFASAGAKFTTAFVRRGLPPEHGMPWLLSRAIGEGRARELVLSGRVVLAEEAMALGLVHDVVPEGQVLVRAKEWASDVAANCSPRAVAAGKELLGADRFRSLPEAIVAGNAMAGVALPTADFREGVDSFLDRRPPKFAPLGR